MLKTLKKLSTIKRFQPCFQRFSTAKKLKTIASQDLKSCILIEPSTLPCETPIVKMQQNLAAFQRYVSKKSLFGLTAQKSATPTQSFCTGAAFSLNSRRIFKYLGNILYSGHRQRLCAAIVLQKSKQLRIAGAHIIILTKIQP